MELDLSFWKNASSKRKRIYTILFILIIAIIITVIGSYVPLSHGDAQTISNDLNQTLNTHKSNGTLTEYIFQNNFQICLLMFIPIIGPILGFAILFNTGVALGAISSVQGYPAFIALISEFLTPVFWLEFIAYSTAIAASIWLTRWLWLLLSGKLEQQRRWRELRNLAIQIGMCAGILAVSAVIEVWLISIGI